MDSGYENDTETHLLVLRHGHSKSNILTTDKLQQPEFLFRQMVFQWLEHHLQSEASLETSMYHLPG
jgi:hypothetical protein